MSAKLLPTILLLCLIQSYSAFSQGVILTDKQARATANDLLQGDIAKREVVDLKNQITLLEANIRDLKGIVAVHREKDMIWQQQEYAWKLEAQSLEDELLEARKKLRSLRWQKGLLIGAGAVSEPSPLTAPQQVYKRLPPSEVYHTLAHYSKKPGTQITNLDGLVPCKTCKP